MLVFHLFIFYGEISVKLLGSFFNWIVFLSLISRFLCTFWVTVLYQMSFANTLFQPVDCLLILLTFPFQSRNFNFNEAQFTNYFIDWAFLVQFRSLAQSCPTLCDPMDCSPPVSSVHGIFQARVLEWGAIAFSDNLCLLDTYYMSGTSPSFTWILCSNHCTQEGYVRDLGLFRGLEIVLHKWNTGCTG